MSQAPRSFHCRERRDAERIVGALRALGEIEAGRPQRRRSLYFDSFDWRLFAAGTSLAVRNGETGSEVALFEHGCPVAIAVAEGGLPTGFAVDLPKGMINRVVAPLIDVRRLLPRLVVTAEVLPVTLRDRDAKTVLRAEIGQIVCRDPAGGARADLGTRVDLHPIRGYGKHARKAGRAIEALLGCDRLSDPLLAEGLRALGREAGDYTSKLRLALDVSMCAGEASRLIHLTLLDTMARNEDGTARNIDSEFLHDFRVAVRRTRSALSLIDKNVLPADVIRRAKEDFRWLGKRTNRMRDLDVYLIAVPEYKASLPKTYRPALDVFHDHLLQQSRREGRRVAALVRSRRYRDLKQCWRGYLESSVASPEEGREAMRPVRDLASHRIRKTYRRLIREGSGIADDSPNEALHELRLTGKKLRYLLEFFQSLYPPDELERLIGELKKLQNVLGEFQDTEIQSIAIREFAHEMAEAGLAPLETQMAMGMVADSILRRQAVARSAFQKRFAGFSAPGIRKRVQRLFYP